MRTLCAAAFLALAFAATAAAQPKLADETALFKIPGNHLPGAWEPDLRSLSSLQLSPDAAQLLYVQRREKTDKPEDRPTSRLVLRDLAAQKETVLPIPMVTGEAGVLNHLLTGRLFDPLGKRLALGIGIPAEGAETVDSPGQKDPMRAAVYDIASGKLRKLDLEGPAILPLFDSTGKTLMVLSYDLQKNTGTLYRAQADKLDFKPVETLGLPRAPCPGSDLVATLTKREKPQDSEYKLVLYDLKTDKPVQEPTATGPNWNLILSPPLWTADGRYLCYPCGEKVDEKFRWVTRVWDRTAGKVAADLSDVYAVGPGPTPTTLVLGKGVAGNKRGFDLYDCVTGKSVPLGDKELQPLAAGGGKVFYIRRIGDDDTFCSARIALHAADGGGK
jgi:hypothetical protein